MLYHKIDSFKMKLVANYLLVVCLVGFMPSNSFSQETVLDRLSATESNGKVFLEWVISAGNTCQGIRILRSVDSLEFNQIGDIGGVCGSLTIPQRYTFTDLEPFKNVINYYRLDLGGIGLSKIVSAKVIDLGANGNQVIPNPIVSESKIYFSNPAKTETQLIIYQLNGTILSKEITRESFFTVRATELKPGIYIFSISIPGSQEFTKGKFVVF